MVLSSRWDGTKIAEVDDGQTHNVSFWPTTDMLGCTLSDGVLLRNAASLEPIGDPISHPGLASVEAVGSRRGLILTSCYDQLARLWDASTHSLVYPAIADVGGYATMTPDEKVLVNARTKGVCRVIDPVTTLRVCSDLSFRFGTSLSGDGRMATTADSRFIIIGGHPELCIIDRKRVLPDPVDELESLMTWCEVVSGHRFEQERPIALGWKERQSRWSRSSVDRFRPAIR